MDGVNILNTEEILEAPCWAFDALAISAIACIVFVIGIIIIVSIAEYVGVDLDFLCTIFLGLFTVSGILTIVFGIVNCLEISPTGVYRYEATIDDSVKINELHEHYNVVEQRGDIWILEDKE